MVSMNRVPTSPDFIADALQLIALPACACDACGMVVAANGALQNLAGQGYIGPAAGRLFYGRLPRVEHEHAARRAGCGRARASVGQQPARQVSGAIAVQVWSRPLPVDDGLPGATLVFADIRVQQRDQQALRKTLLEQQAILESAAVGIIFSKGGFIEECNIRAAEMLGYARHQLTGMPGAVLYRSAEHCRALGLEAAPLLSKGKPYRTELELRRQDGTLFWSRLHGRAVDPLHTHDGTVWIIEDISDHRRDEDQLRRAMLEMQAVMDNAPLAIGFQRDKGVLRYNRRFAECFGFDGDSGVGLAVADLYPSRAAYESVVRQAAPLLRRGLPFQGEMEMRRRDGSTFWALGVRLCAEPGEPVRARAARHDLAV